MLQYAVFMLEKLNEAMLEPIGPEGRLKVFNTLMHEAGIEDSLPLICKETGKLTQAAEDYHRCLTILIEHAKKSC